jgi:hypothetical protein
MRPEMPGLMGKSKLLQIESTLDPVLLDIGYRLMVLEK